MKNSFHESRLINNFGGFNMQQPMHPSFGPQMAMSPEMMNPMVLYNQMNAMAINQLMNRGQQAQQLMMQQRMMQQNILQQQQFMGMGSRPQYPTNWLQPYGAAQQRQTPQLPWAQRQGNGMFAGGPMQNFVPSTGPYDVPPGGLHYTNPSVVTGLNYAFVGPGRMPPMTPQLPSMTQFLQQQQQAQTPPPQLFNFPQYAQQMYGVNMFGPQMPGMNMNQVIIHVPGPGGA